MTDPDADLVDALQAENDALRLRVEQLDAAAAEYRRQMAVVLESLSWRLTSPIRMSAGRLRLAKRLIHEWRPRRARSRRRADVPATAGLFPPAAPPTGSLATPESPLLAKPHRSPRLVGPDPAAGQRSHRVLVVAHAFYPEVWPDLRDRLARMPESFDLIVTLTRGHSENLEPDIRRRYPQARIHLIDNYGRDLASVLELASMGAFDGYDAILKIHTKRSPHRLDGDGWRLQLLDGVLPSPGGISRIIELIRTDRTVGLVVPSGNLKGPETWGSDRELVEALAARIPFAFDPDQLEYAAGSMYWVRPWVLRRLADLSLSAEHFEPEAGHYDGSTAHALERFVGLVTTASGLTHVETHEVASRLHRARRRATTHRPRVLAFYLPQYHRIPENDEWWGKGFTDWKKVDAARPLYAGHQQPVEPGELGHYDLSDPDAIRRQAALARRHGIDGFVMHHYWFNGKPLLDTPLRQLLADPDIDLPFALCWANENWTRRWDGLDSEILIKQRYQPGWALRFYRDLTPALHDPRYLRVNGKPMLVIYRVADIPDAKAAISGWKQRAKADGLGGLHVLAVLPSRDFAGARSEVGSVIDGWVRFPPGSGVGLHSVRNLAPDATVTGDVYSYDAAVDGADLSTDGPFGLPLHPGVMPGWDNTPRRGEAAYVFHGANPLSFRRWLDRAVNAAGRSERMVFVNAWNEWAEGAHLEPDAKFGRGNLEAVYDVVGDCLPTDAGGAAVTPIDVREANRRVPLELPA